MFGYKVAEQCFQLSSKAVVLVGQKLIWLALVLLQIHLLLFWAVMTVNGDSACGFNIFHFHHTFHFQEKSDDMSHCGKLFRKMNEINIFKRISLKKRPKISEKFSSCKELQLPGHPTEYFRPEATDLQLDQDHISQNRLTNTRPGDLFVFAESTQESTPLVLISLRKLDLSHILQNIN